MEQLYTYETTRSSQEQSCQYRLHSTYQSLPFPHYTGAHAGKPCSATFRQAEENFSNLVCRQEMFDWGGKLGACVISWCPPLIPALFILLCFTYYQVPGLGLGLLSQCIIQRKYMYGTEAGHFVVFRRPLHLPK